VQPDLNERLEFEPAGNLVDAPVEEHKRKTLQDELKPGSDQ
jgi:hypothetical protein